jgi:aryl-alcohol dehydrogenase-like predicted oxidoreductase
VTTFDTANAYVDGESERILGRALAGRRERFVVATKVGFGRVAGKPEGLARDRVLAALEESLVRLGTDHVDVYYLHVPDHQTPIEETLGAMEEILESGKARTFGVSNYASWQILEIFHACETLAMPRPVVSQQLYNLLIRQLDVEYWRFSRKYELHTTVYNPLAGGLLTGRYHAGDAAPRGSRFDGNKLYLSRYFSPPLIALAEELEALAKDEGLTLVELAYAWLAGVPGVDSILVGPGSLEHLDQALDAIGRDLSTECRAKIDVIHRAYLGTETTYAR